MNSNVVGLSQAALTSPSSTVLLFEVSGDMAPVASYDEGTDSGAGTLAYKTAPAAGIGLSPVGNGLQGALYSTITTTAPANGAALYATGPISAQYSTSLTGFGQFQALTGLHTDGSNYLCSDGHVKWYKGEKVSGGVSAASATYAQVGNAANAAATGTGGLGTGTSYSLTQALTFSSI
jgi:hypothetical protein